MSEELRPYSDKRDFGRTPEPRGSDAKRARSARRKAQPAARFVVQEHSARNMHWDLRLEVDGVLVSWAVPHGMPLVPGVNNLAVQTEDHPLEYLTFEGDIPKGNYGAGSMKIFDSGTYEAVQWNEKKIDVVLHGEVLKGKYGLFHMRDRNWMVHRMDAADESHRQRMPEKLEPMLARTGVLPPAADESKWGYEIKWDGIRCLAYVSGGRVHLESRNRNEITHQYPELAKLGRALGAREAVLDCEIVALDERGLPSFQLLQSRMGLKNESSIRRRAQSAPATLMIFDVLFLDGAMTIELPYRERRALVESLGLAGESFQTPAYSPGESGPLLELTSSRGMEGLIAKRLDSTYAPGRRTGAWVKVKHMRRQEFVIGGYTSGEGAREGTLGALLVGYHDEDGKLVYAGSVGTGFSDELLVTLTKQLAKMSRATSPFAIGSPGSEKPIGKWRAMSAKGKRLLPQTVHYVTPKLVGEVEYAEFTRDGTLRHPSFKGLRPDRSAKDVVLEVAKEAEPVPVETKGKSTSHEVTVGSRKLKLSNLGKVLYPQANFTKADVIDYYTRVAPVLLPHLKDRALTLKRYPNGVDGDFFYEKRKPKHAPEWVRSAEIWSGSNAANIEFVLANDLPTLVWLANLADLELHTSLAKAKHPLKPTMLAFDLDPGPPATIVECCRVALLLRDLFGELGLDLYPKTSGSKGMQVYAPLNTPGVTYDDSKPFAHAIARLLEKQHPDLVVSRQLKTLRKGKVLVDWSQNDDHKTTICVYSLRARPQPTVSTPVTWEEVEACAESGDPDDLVFSSTQLLERVAVNGDLFAPVLTRKQKLPKL